jgi:terminase small subunit / prophage DNA-packing protein
LPIADDLLASADDLGRLLGISGRQVRDLAARRIIPRAKRGRYPVVASVMRYCEHLRQLAMGRGDSAAIATATAERSRLLRAQADAQEARNRAALGALLDAGAVEREWSDVIRQSLAAVLAVPARYQARLPHLAVSDVAILDEELREAMRGLGEGGSRA